MALIEQQKALDAIEKCHKRCCRTDSCGDEWIHYETTLVEIESIKPKLEVIHCTDCKHHWVHKCMDSPAIERCDLNQTFYDADYDFCSLAERRTE